MSSVILLTFSAPSMAYIDPGSGSAIMSAVVGFFAAITMLVKTYWYKIKSLFTSRDDKQETNSVSEDQTENS